MAAGAPEPCEARRQTAARQEVATFLLNEARQALAIAQAGGLRAEGFEVIADQLVSGTLLGSARPIGGRGGGHAVKKRKARA